MNAQLARRLAAAERAADVLDGHVEIYRADDWPAGVYAQPPDAAATDYRQAIAPSAMTPDELRAAGWFILTEADVADLNARGFRTMLIQFVALNWPTVGDPERDPDPGEIVLRWPT